MTVYLVGAGPGDPGLLTVRGAQVLGRADVVVYDRLSVSSLLDLAPPEAERISVGKTPRGPSTPQHDINALLVERGRSGATVVRLKGGDPFVFARGGEEAAALAAAGVPFEVVPGVTSAVAVPAYAGIPVTHRGLSTSFTVVTGHEDPWAATETDWEAVARVGGTIVVLMGVATRAAIADRLMAGGLDPTTPVASIQWGTRGQQVTVRTTLAGLARADIASPATLVIGAVAGLDLAWFDSRPLFGRRIVVTRASHQVADIRDGLAELGAEVIAVPAVDMLPASDGGAALADAAARIGTFDWVVLSSANAVRHLFGHVADVRRLGTARVAAVGPATAAALERCRVVADVVALDASASGLVAVMPHGSGTVLLPQSEQARPDLASGLRDLGWHVDAVDAYRTVPAPISEQQKTAAAGADAVVFASPSAVAAWVEAGAPVASVVACIGPTTTAAARDLGLVGVHEATPHTTAGLIALLQSVL